MNRTSRVALLALIAAIGAPSTLHAQTPTRLRVWVKAFIPKVNPVVANAVRPVPGSADKWMIDGPTGPPCYMTDHREFSSSRAASARVTTEFVLVINAGSARVEVPSPATHVHTAGISTQVNCATGAEIASKPGVFSRLRVIGSKLPEDSIGAPATAGTQTQVIFGVVALNPFAPLGISPAIDYSLDLVFDSASKKIIVKGSVGLFPAYEAYAQLGNGAPTTLFRVSPTTATPWGLYDFGTGLGTKPLNGTVQLP